MSPITTVWPDTVVSGFSDPQLYVVQKSNKVIERCLLMTTDPGDLVLDPTCFRAGTRLKTERGWRPIESVRSGEAVWTHAGRLRRVLGRQSRPHVGTLLGLRLEGTEAVVWCTPDHRFLVAPASLSPLPPLHPMERGSGGEDGDGPQASLPSVSPSPLAGRGPGGEVTSAQPETPFPTNAEVHRALGGLNPALIKLARELRHNSTEVESDLWQCLRARRFNGLKFRRQHPLGPHYVSDFYCAETKLSVELDGKVHDSRHAQWAEVSGTVRFKKPACA